MIVALTAALLFGRPLVAPLFEAPFHITDDAIIVDAVVNSRPLSLLFDSGFSGTVVLNEGIDVGPPDGHQTLRDFVGEYDATTVKLKAIQLGGHDLTGLDNQNIVLQNLGNLSRTYNTHVDGLLGLSALKGMVTEINFEHQTFRFYPPSYDISALKPDGQKTYSSELLPIGRSLLVMHVDPGNGKQLVMALDTGNSFFVTTHRDVLERLGLWPLDRDPQYTHLSGVASGNVSTFDVQLKGAKIFGVPVPESIWDVIAQPSSAAESDGTVGFQFLKNFNITFDYNRRHVWMENYTGASVSPPLGEPGMTAGYSKSQHKSVVTSVAPGGPAALAGIAVNDELLGVAGRDVTNMGMRALRRLLAGPIGSKVTVEVSHDGGFKRVELTRQLLVNPIP